MTDTTTPPRERIVAGCMTGTSLDGLDAALVRIVGTGLDMTAEYLGWVSHPMDPGLRDTLMHLASGGAAEPLTYLRAARGVGELYADGVQHLLDETNGPRPAFVVSHGQTIWHAPRDPRQDDQGNIPGGGPKSWQLFDPWPVVRRHGVPVCYDLRQADLIAGGEGAPLTPLADWVMYRDTKLGRYIVNLGGVVNYTSFGPDTPAELVSGDDLIGCNLVLDGIVQHYWPEIKYDAGGQLAGRGKVVEKTDGICQEIWKPKVEAMKRWRSEKGSGSLGREDYSPAWIDELLSTHGAGMRGEDVLACAVDAIASAIAGLVEDYHHDQIVLAGGSCRNETLVASISAQSKAYGAETLTSDDLGIPCEAREAMGFAVLGALSQDGVPCSLPQVTRATDPGVAGVWAGV